MTPEQLTLDLFTAERRDSYTTTRAQIEGSSLKSYSYDSSATVMPMKMSMGS